MGIALEKPELFPDKKIFIFFLLASAFVILLRLGYSYQTYLEFIQKPFYFTYATVLNTYEKQNGKRHYRVLKLQSDEGWTFFTTSYSKAKLERMRLRLQIFPHKGISFVEYMSTFYVKSKIKEKELLPYTFKDRVLSYIKKQHTNMQLASFYNAIFFAVPLEKTLREKIALLGVSHLVALSGFHLTILWGIVYGLLLLLYRPLQQRYFPYRHALLDVGMITMGILALYVWFVGFPPSLVRSFGMVFIGWAVLLLGMELLSFMFLATVIAILLISFPALVFSLSFWLSVAGVFYIFLLLHYTKTFEKRVIALVIIPFGIFIFMLPFVHGVFGSTSSYQLLSPLLSLLFIPFYPLVIFLHVLGIGDSLDSFILWLFSLPMEGREHLLSLWIVAGYILLSLISIKSKRVFYITFGLATLYMIYLFIPV